MLIEFAKQPDALQLILQDQLVAIVGEIEASRLRRQLRFFRELAQDARLQ